MSREFSISMSKFTSDLLKNIDKKLVPEIVEMSAEYAVELITKRVQGQGKGLAANYGTTYSLKPLSAKYIAYRQRNVAILSAATSATKSNLTLTGQMLESMRAARTSNSDTWRVVIDGTRSDGKNNSDIARFASKARPFMFLSGGEVGQIRNMIQKVLPALAKRNLSR